MIHVIATVELEPGARDAFLAILRPFASEVRTEEGCIEYGPAADARVDIGRPIPCREDAVIIIERWESPEALKTHLAQPRMAQYKQDTRDFVKGVALHVLEPL